MSGHSYDFMENFWPYYKNLVSQLYEPLSQEDGFSEDEVEGAEKRLGLRLPGPLREYYLLAGKREDLNQTHNKLAHPNELQMGLLFAGRRMKLGRLGRRKVNTVAAR